MITLNKKVFIMLVFAILLFVFFLDAEARTLNFQPLPGGPSARKGNTVIYDSEHNQAVFFGGQGTDSYPNDLWKLNLSDLSWSLVPTSGDIPLSRQGHTAIYDPVNKRMLIFAGTNPNYVFNDLYSLDLNTNIWTQLSPGGILPSPRWNHTAIYNPADSSMVIFGGRQLYQGLEANGGSDTTSLNNAGISNTLMKGQVQLPWFNDLWKLDLKTLTWSQLTPLSELPAAREFHSATYVPVGNSMVVYAGYADGLDYGDLWKYDFATNIWSQIVPSGEQPMSREAHSAFYDDSKNCILIFGGNSHSLRYFGDIWEFDLNRLSWKNISPYLGRSSPAAIYDPQRQGLIIDGGFALNAYYDPYYFGDGYLITSSSGAPFSYGDANCDGQVTVTDVVYTINFLFKGGPTPCSVSEK
ncbi:MAG TPA: kelch repeat-containing protein [Terriglobales bacterium]|nr:kelch repeat-containing protein [Terriglobales bacterium]